MGQVYSYSLVPGPTPAFGDYNSLKSKDVGRKNEFQKGISNQNHESRSGWNKGVGFLSNEFQNLNTGPEPFSDSIHSNYSNQYSRSRNHPLLSSNPDILNEDLDTQSNRGLISKPKVLVKSHRRNKVSSILASARSYLLSSSSSTSNTNCHPTASPVTLRSKVSSTSAQIKSNKSKIGCFSGRHGHDYDKHRNGHDLIRTKNPAFLSDALEPEQQQPDCKHSKSSESRNGFFDLKNSSRNGRGVHLFPVPSNSNGALEASRTSKKQPNNNIDFNTSNNSLEDEEEEEENGNETSFKMSQKDKKKKKSKKLDSKAGLIQNPVVVKLSRDEVEEEKKILSRGMSNSFSCYNLHQETLLSSDADSQVSRDHGPLPFRPDLGLNQQSSIPGSTSTNQSGSEEGSFRRSSIGEDEEAPFIDEDVEDENGELVSPTSLNCKISHLDSLNSSNRMGLNGHQEGSAQLPPPTGFSFHSEAMRNKDDQAETSSSSSSSIATSLMNDWRKRRVQPEPPAVQPMPVPRIQISSPSNCHRSVKCYQTQLQQPQQPQQPMVFLTSSNKERNASNPMYQETRNGKLVNANGTINRNKTVIQASTSELLRALGDYVEAVIASLRNPNLEFNTHDLAFWLRSVDRSLLIQGWQEIAFVNPANLVFLYLLLRDMIQETVRRQKLTKISDLQSLTLTCLYISYGYMGNEISYPLKPFLCDGDSREDFFDRALFIINRMSGKMLQINADPSFFTSTFSDLLLGNHHPHQQQQQQQLQQKLQQQQLCNNRQPQPVDNFKSLRNCNQVSDIVNDNIPRNHQFNDHYKSNGSKPSHPLTSSSNFNNNINYNNPLVNIR